MLMKMPEIPDNYDILMAQEQRQAHSRRLRCLGRCAVCEENVVDGETHYIVMDEMIHADCIQDWLEQYRIR